MSSSLPSVRQTGVVYRLSYLVPLKVSDKNDVHRTERSDILPSSGSVPFLTTPSLSSATVSDVCLTTSDLLDSPDPVGPNVLSTFGVHVETPPEEWSS